MELFGVTAARNKDFILPFLQFDEFQLPEKWIYKISEISYRIFFTLEGGAVSTFN